MSPAALTTKTIRLPSALVDATEARADEIGLTFSDVVEDALTAHLGLPRNASFEVLEDVRAFLLDRYPQRTGFPRDVTLEVFLHLRDEPDARRRYRSALSGGTGGSDESLRASLHRRVGKAVKQVLGARVVGRSLPLDPDEVLIQSHALLEPGGSSGER